MTEEKIKSHFKTEYSSSPCEVASEDIAVYIANDCECGRCRESIFSLYDFPTIIEGSVWCEDCQMEEFYLTCDICENSFLKATKPEEEVIIISKEAVKSGQMDVLPGFYQIKEWPYFRACVVYGFETLFTEAVELIKELDINSMKDKINPRNKPHRIMAGECCHDCMKKYTGQTKLINNYINKAYGKKQITLMRKVIKNGK